jgi:hypothetical protein
VYKKVIKISFTQQKIFWVLVFSFMYLVSVDPMDRSQGCKKYQQCTKWCENLIEAALKFLFI